MLDLFPADRGLTAKDVARSLKLPIGEVLPQLEKHVASGALKFNSSTDRYSRVGAQPAARALPTRVMAALKEMSEPVGTAEVLRVVERQPDQSKGKINGKTISQALSNLTSQGLTDRFERTEEHPRLRFAIAGRFAAEPPVQKAPVERPPPAASPVPAPPVVTDEPAEQPPASPPNDLVAVLAARGRDDIRLTVMRAMTAAFRGDDTASGDLDDAIAALTLLREAYGE